jgi:hypothetical protein
VTDLRETLLEAWHVVHCAGNHDVLAYCEYRDSEVVYSRIDAILATTVMKAYVKEAQAAIEATK